MRSRIASANMLIRVSPFPASTPSDPSHIGRVVIVLKPQRRGEGSNYSLMQIEPHFQLKLQKSGCAYPGL
jgi:hypothetical protein